MIVSPSNKIYIGQTTNFKKRLNNHKNCNQKTKLYHSFNKHGFSNHKIEVVLDCQESELDFWERFYIKIFDSFNSEHGLNLTDGGNGGRKVSYVPKSQSFKEKMSTIKIGKKRGKFSEEWLNNLSKSSKKAAKRDTFLEERRKGAITRKKNGKDWFDKETKEKISQTLIKYNQTEKGLQQRSKLAVLAKNKFGIKIGKFNSDGELLNTYDSIREAAKSLGINYHKTIMMCCDKNKLAHNYYWKRI